MTHEEGLAASNPISRLGAGHQHLGEGGGLRAEPSPGTWSVLSLPFAHPDLIFFAFKLFCRVTLEQKNPPPKKKEKGYAVYLLRTPNPEVRVSWLTDVPSAREEF